MEQLLEFHLNADQSDQIHRLACKLVDDGLDPRSEARYNDVTVAAAGIPDRLRRTVSGFVNEEPSFGMKITGVSISPDSCGPTPSTWQRMSRPRAEAVAATQLALIGTLFGHPFTWSTLQGGSMIQDLMPVQEDKQEQSGHGSVLLQWHTEDAFHPNRCDYLLLMGIRNPDMVPTTASSIRDVTLGEEYKSILAGRRFLIRPDNEHIRQLAANDPESPALARMIRMREDPEPVAVLFGELSDPYLRVDPFFMESVPHDKDAQDALEVLVNALDGVEQSIVIDPGTILVVDNNRAVHGRSAYEPRFDGTDRWLKKLSVTTNIRASRSLRRSAGSRVI